MKKLFPVFAASVLLLAGCGTGTGSAAEGGKSSDKLSTVDVCGTWCETRSNCTDTYKFKADMTYDRTITYTDGSGMDSSVHDNWSLTDDTISIHATEFGQVTDYKIAIDGSTMTWSNGDTQIVFQKVS